MIVIHEPTFSCCSQLKVTSRGAARVDVPQGLLGLSGVSSTGWGFVGSGTVIAAGAVRSAGTTISDRSTIANMRCRILRPSLRPNSAPILGGCTDSSTSKKPTVTQTANTLLRVVTLLKILEITSYLR